jgi:multiple sugar transport system ATP-binding protein
MARVQLLQLSKRFGQTSAVVSLSLDIAEGEFLTLLGGSGCGKTTTLNLIAGLEPPSSGRILFDDEDVTALSPRERNVAVVFQSYALYPHKTVADNLAFPLRMTRVAKAEIATRVQEIARLLQIEPLLTRKPRELSGGQQQRVALGRALIRRPRVFLLDEPLSNLDARLRVAVRQEIKALHTAVGATMVYVTHDQEEALALSDRIAVMHAGTILQCAPPRDIYVSPANRTVAELVGSPPINILDITVHGSALVLPGGRSIPVPETYASWLSYLPPHFHIGVRPEHVLLTEKPGGARGEVRQIEHLGKETQIRLDAGAYALTALANAENSLQTEAIVSWSWDWNRLLCFDPQTGKNLFPHE